jgi:hypothetical protein
MADRIQHHSFNDLELLGAVQALLIYTIMRMVDGPLPENDFDYSLLASLNVSVHFDTATAAGLIYLL